MSRRPGMLHWILFPGQGKRGAPVFSAPLQPMPCRPIRELEIIREQYGTAFAAAYAGVINYEEYLKLERLREN